MNTDLTAKTRLGSAVAAAQARHQIGIPGVMGFTLGAAAPLTVVAGAAATAFGVAAFVGVPIAYLVVGLVLAFFASGYVAMARAIGQTGGFYVYVTHGSGRVPGVAAAFVAQLAYNILQISFYGIVGAGMAAGLDLSTVGWKIPWWIYALATWALVAVVGLRSMAFNKRVLAALLIAELAVIIAIDAALLSNPHGGSVNMSALNPRHLLAPAAMAILVGGVAGYSGFESGVVYSEVAKDRKRTVAWATVLALAVITSIYVVSTWAMTVATGTAGIVESAQTHQADLLFALAADHLPAWILDTGRLLLLTSLIAALIAFHNMIARMLFSLGRDRLLPTAFGRPGRRSAAPVWGSLTQSALALVSIIGFAIAGLDPIKHVFFALGVTGGLGILILMLATSVAVIGFFKRHNTFEPVWRRVIAPVIALTLLSLILLGTIFGFAELVGLPAHSPWRWILPGSYGVAAFVGIVAALIIRRRRPDVYAAIGQGPDNARLQPSHPTPTPTA